MTNICAGIGRGQMEALEQYIGLRRSIHNFYQETFKEIEGVTVFKEPSQDYFSNHWLSAIVIDSKKANGKTSEDLRLSLEKANIESRPLWKPMHLQPVFESYPFYLTGISESLFQTGLCLPSSSNLSEEEKRRIFSELQYFFQ